MRFKHGKLKRKRKCLSKEATRAADAASKSDMGSSVWDLSQLGLAAA